MDKIRAQYEETYVKPMELEEGSLLGALDSESGARAAVVLAYRYGGFGGEHHKAWVIDQMVRALVGSDYEELVRQACEGEDGPDTYDWDTGIAP